MSPLSSGSDARLAAVPVRFFRRFSIVPRLAPLLLACYALDMPAQSINITPSSPNSIDRVMVSVPMSGAPFPGSDSSLSQAVVGNVIYVAVILDGFDWGPNPPWLASYLVGPFTPGQYTVQFEARNVHDGPVVRTATAQFQVIDVTQTDLRSAVEYWRPGVDHYFMSAYPTEISLLDANYSPGWTIDPNRPPGWMRTGQVISVYPSDTPFAPGLSPVCRFYGKPEAGLDSHFFSASPSECQAVIDRFSNAWIYESQNVFLVYLPNQADGSCPPNTTPVYRLYNNRPDVNHRYTTLHILRDSMANFGGWVPEGYGPDGVAMCAPQQ